MRQQGVCALSGTASNELVPIPDISELLRPVVTKRAWDLRPGYTLPDYGGRSIIHVRREAGTNRVVLTVPKHWFGSMQARETMELEFGYNQRVRAKPPIRRDNF